MGPSPSELVLVLVFVAAPALLTAAIARWKGRKLVRWFLIGIGITMGAAMVMGIVYAAVTSRAVAVASVCVSWSAGPVAALLLRSKRPAGPSVPDPSASRAGSAHDEKQERPL